jgi:undecaprenyl pyrophosphate phosphatase UppP
MNKRQQNPNKTYLPEMAIVGSVAFELGFMIALPIVLFASLGRWLDNRFGTKHYLLLGIAIAIISSVFWVYKRLTPMIDKLNKIVKEAEEKKKQDDNKRIE